MNELYYSGYEPPMWSIKLEESFFNLYAKKCLVICGKECDRNIIKGLINEREPVNISMTRIYDKNKLYEYCKYEYSFYYRYFRKYNIIAPNIGIYTFTPVKLNNTFIDCHIYNAIGYAFDNHLQPDFIYFNNLNFDKDILINLYAELLGKIIKCAKHLNLSTVIWSAVGCNNFAMMYPGRSFYDEIFKPAFLTLDSTDLIYESMGDYIDNDIVSKKHINLFPDILNDIDVSKTLIVNAWDPHSIAGNGNNNDRSLDGFVGRNSMIGRLSWGITNVFLKDEHNWLNV